MRVIIDRFEGEYAVVELPNRIMYNIPRAILPPEAKEGDVIDIRVDKEETKKRKNKMRSLMDDLWE